MHRVGITGVGGGVGQSIIKCLIDSEYELFGLDADPLAPGLYQVPQSQLVPYASNDDFIPSLLKICTTQRIDHLFPGLDAELPKLAAHRNDFAQVATNVVVSDEQVVDIADDKLKTVTFLKSLGLPAPTTRNIREADSVEWQFPVVVKPQRGGARSKNVRILNSLEELDHFTTFVRNPDDYVIQEYIHGDEYTCGSLTLDQECCGVIVMKRLLRGGDTHKCFALHHEGIEATVRRICKALNPQGALNVQLRLKNNIPYVFELNARCSGTTAARALCGFNEPKFIADYFLKNEKPELNVESQTILRYWQELVVANAKVKR